MPDKNLTDNEIKKALECCGKQFDCVFCECVENCPQDTNKLNGLALDLINRLQAEKQNLEVELKAMRGAANSYKAENERLKSRKEVVVPSMRFIDGNPLNGFNLESNRFVARTVEDVKAEAYKEFAERLNKSFALYYGINGFDAVSASRFVDNLLKEMVGENDEKT